MLYSSTEEAKFIAFGHIMLSPIQVIIASVAVVFAIVVSIRMNQIHTAELVNSLSSTIDQSQMANIGTQYYIADYELPVKSINRGKKHFTVYLIDEGDLFVKKQCKCQSIQECDSENVVFLAK